MSKEERRLIFNGEDFGFPGINKAIFELIDQKPGILKSTSVIVSGPAAGDVKFLRDLPDISVGLHFYLTGEVQRNFNLLGTMLWPARRKFAAFMDQWNKLSDLLGREPDHIDGHHNIHRAPGFAKPIVIFAREKKKPVRSVDYGLVLGFHDRGVWEGNVGRGIEPDNLLSLVNRLPNGTFAFACHPGYVDQELLDTGTKYTYPRQTEKDTLMSPEVIAFFEQIKDTTKIINTKQIFLANS